MLMNQAHKNTQQGLALFVSLIFLLILTIIGISAMRTTIMEEKMVGNFKDYNLAFQSSELSLRVAENWLLDLEIKPGKSNSPGDDQVWSRINAASDPSAGGKTCDNDKTMWWKQCGGDWWEVNAQLLEDEYMPEMSSVNTNPYYLIEEQVFVPDSLVPPRVGKPPGRYIYRVTAKGTGGSDLSRVLLQSTFATRF